MPNKFGRKKRAAKLQMRIERFNAVKNKDGFKRPGSMNPRKQA